LHHCYIAKFRIFISTEPILSKKINKILFKYLLGISSNKLAAAMSSTSGAWKTPDAEATGGKVVRFTICFFFVESPAGFCGAFGHARDADTDLSRDARGAAAGAGGAGGATAGKHR
jgi:hypothetical protein